jgi:hypothetical protein
MPAAGQPTLPPQQQAAIGFAAAPDGAAQLLVRDNAVGAWGTRQAAGVVNVTGCSSP